MAQRQEGRGSWRQGLAVKGLAPDAAAAGCCRSAADGRSSPWTKDSPLDRLENDMGFGQARSSGCSRRDPQLADRCRVSEHTNRTFRQHLQADDSAECIERQTEQL